MLYLPRSGASAIQVHSCKSDEMFIFRLVRKIVENQETIMADFTKLNATLTKLQNDLAAYQQAVTAAIDAIKNSTAADQAGVDAATTSLEGIDTAITAATAALNPPSNG